MVTRCLLISLLCLTISCTDSDKKLAGSDKDRLSGTAEDLWGNKIELADYASGVTLISPVSPATCGYCLMDGNFIEANFHRKTREMGGYDLYQALFVPQIDVYTFLKHYRIDSTVTLTYPLSLQHYQEDGFPYAMGFNNGRKIFASVIADYREAYKKFVHTMWPQDTGDAIVLSSPRKLAENYFYDDPAPAITYVVPDTMEEFYANLKERSANKKGYRVSLERQLSEADLQNNLIFEGWTYQYSFDLFKDQPIPLRFDSTHVYLGDYSFSKPDIGLSAIFPNPYNPETYVSLRMPEKHTGQLLPELWADFSVWRYKSKEEPAELILDGFFEKQPGGGWRFADSLAIAHVNLTDFCKGGICPLPPSALRDQVQHEFMPNATTWETTPAGAVMTLGDAVCRFPAIATGSDESAAVVWEERGDIFLATLHENEPPNVLAVEHSSFDSFNPKVVAIPGGFFVAYLSNKDGWYRLYGRYVDSNKLSPDLQLSPVSSFDVITPALAADKSGRILAAWSEWKAHRRYLNYRFIDGRTPGPIQPLWTVAAGIDDYTNAWCASLTFDANGNPAGAWNQHYPATLGVCAGNLSDMATSVTSISGDISRNECGGYPTTAFDADGRQWVARETYWWNTYKTGSSQQILAARFSPVSKLWSTPYAVSSDNQTYLNQSPSMTADPSGRLWLTWSGRADSPDSTWGVYLASYDGSNWSDPELVSTPGICGRAPDIAADARGRIWITWHSGTGDSMVIRVLRIDNQN